MAYFPTNFTISPWAKVTGNFTASGYGARYMWSGVATTWTGSLGTPASISGASMTIKNISTGAPLFLTGSVDYSLNYTLQPRAAVTLQSDAATWVVIC